jgi:gamma-glutamylputrescine oxidase
MWSYWEQTSFLEYDFVVTGGGIVGLSAALSLRELHPRARILVTERGWLPQGASTRNAGFACFGSLSEILADLRTHTEQEVIALCLLRWRGLELLRQRLGDDMLQFIGSGSHELLWEGSVSLCTEINRINKLLEPHLGADIFSEDKDAVQRFGFSGNIKTTIKNRLEGSIDTGRMMQGLIGACGRAGVEIRNGGNVDTWTEDAKGVALQISSGNDRYIVNTRQWIVCTNAFAKNLLPQLDIVPGRGQVILTKPIQGLTIRGIFHFDEGFYYFRNIGDRILFGGGRNLDFDTEQTTAFGTTDRIQHQLKKYLHEVLLPGKEVEIDYTWSGIMAFGSRRLPLIEKTSPRISIGVRMGGMGVAIGSAVGRELAQLAGKIDD